MIRGSASGYVRPQFARHVLIESRVLFRFPFIFACVKTPCRRFSHFMKNLFSSKEALSVSESECPFARRDEGEDITDMMKGFQRESDIVMTV